jgi:hypothetical protein
MAGDEGPVQTVGWGVFALPGERERLREKEAARMAEVERLRKIQRSDTAVTTIARVTADSALGSRSHGRTTYMRHYVHGPSEGGWLRRLIRAVVGSRRHDDITDNLETRFVRISQRALPGQQAPKSALEFVLELPSSSWDDWHTVVRALYEYLQSISLDDDDVVDAEELDLPVQSPSSTPHRP